MKNPDLFRGHFESSHVGGDPIPTYTTEITLLDLFAAASLAGQRAWSSDEKHPGCDEEDCAALAYRDAWAMLDARERNL